MGKPRSGGTNAPSSLAVPSVLSHGLPARALKTRCSDNSHLLKQTEQLCNLPRTAQPEAGFEAQSQTPRPRARPCLLPPGRACPLWPTVQSLLLNTIALPASRPIPCLKNPHFYILPGGRRGWAAMWATSLPTHSDLPTSFGPCPSHPASPGTVATYSQLGSVSVSQPDSISHSAYAFRKTSVMAGD